MGKSGKPDEHKVIVVGGGGAGKSALTQMFMYNNFVEEYDPTTADSYRKIHEVDGIKCQLDILDTAGQEEYMRDNYYKLGEGFLIVYAVTIADTFAAVERFYDHIVQVKGTSDVPVVVVGSKCDLESLRQVDYAALEALANRLGIPFFETSAKTKQNVNESFSTLVQRMRACRQPTPEGGGCCIIS